MPARKKKMLELAGSGDDGSTGLLGGGRAPKDDPRIEAYGTVDEASSAVGLAKSLSPHQRVRSICEEVQRGLYALGAELATNPDSSASFAHTTKGQVERLDALIFSGYCKKNIVRQVARPGGSEWAPPVLLVQ